MKLITKVKKSKDGMALLNVGCGTKMNSEWNNLDFSSYSRLAGHKKAALLLRKTGILSEERYRKLKDIDPDVIHCDVRRGIPFADGSLDVVYHSHMLEHIEKNAGLSFLKECRRVLKPGGIIRIVVPDLEQVIKQYTSSFSKLDKGDRAAVKEHLQAIDLMFEQMVRTVPAGTVNQRPFVRFIERIIRRDAVRIGERHKWMYDRSNLSEVLAASGFSDIVKHTPETSAIKGWKEFHLDTEKDGSIYQPMSLYIEAVKR